MRKKVGKRIRTKFHRLARNNKFFDTHSLKYKLTMTVFVSVIFMILTILVSWNISFYSIQVVGDSYKSNMLLNQLFVYIEQGEGYLDSFVKNYNYDEIDSFNVCKKKIKDELGNWPDSYYQEELSVKRYVIAQLVESWLSLSDKVISCRISSSLQELKENYSHLIECYNMLVSQISDYEAMILKDNKKSFDNNSFTILKIFQLVFVYFAISFAIILFLLYLNITRILEPLENISETANLVAKRKFDIPLFNCNTRDEIGNICRAFDSMIISINEYMNTILEKARNENELKEKQNEMLRLYSAAKISALQNQISPHFLFNTLNTGVQLAMMEGADKTSEFIEQLAAFFRYNIRPEHQTATIDEELMLTEHFVYIMKVRFGSRLEFRKNLPQEKFSQKLPSMTLQPLVENCIKHGLLNSQGLVELSIRRITDFVEITISDNGQGFDPEVREKILSVLKENPEKEDSYVLAESQEHAGIGIINVVSRLKLFFQRNDIFDIQNKEEGGAKFIIKVPDYVLDFDN